MHRPVTSEDQEIIDTINRNVFEAWKLWRSYFNRTPEQAAELLIKAIKDHERLDKKEMSASSRSEVDDLTKH